jgi:hypothetical protein
MVVKGKTHSKKTSHTHVSHHDEPQPFHHHEHDEKSPDNKTMMVSVMIFIMLLIAYVGFYTYRNVKPSYLSRNPALTPTVVPSTDEQTAEGDYPVLGEPVVNTVVLDGPSFKPVTLTVKKDSIVMWVNESGKTQMLTISLSGVKREEVQPKNMVAYIFTQAGQYSFQTDANPRVTGKIIVE